ncbi:MAG: hypothetical protein AAB614_01225 [Patescibacteria group bacterium]
MNNLHEDKKYFCRICGNILKIKKELLFCYVCNIFIGDPATYQKAFNPNSFNSIYGRVKTINRNKNDSDISIMISIYVFMVFIVGIFILLYFGFNSEILFGGIDMF